MMNPGNGSFNPLANCSDQPYEQIRRWNVIPYKDQQGKNFHSAGATYKGGVIFQLPLYQTDNCGRTRSRSEPNLAAF